MRTAAEIHDVKAVGRWVVLVIKALKDWVTDLGGTVFRAEADAEALFWKVGVVSTEML